MPTSLPSASHATWPAVYTSRPPRVPGEYGYSGLGKNPRFRGRRTSFGISISSSGWVERGVEQIGATGRASATRGASRSRRGGGVPPATQGLAGGAQAAEPVEEAHSEQ